MRLRAWKLILLSISFALAGAPPPALVQSPSEAGLNTLYERATTLYRTGRYADAIPLARQYAVATKARYGGNDPEYAAALSNLAELLKATNRLAEAEQLYRRAIETFEKKEPDKQPNYVAALNNLAVLLKDTNRFAEAEPLMRRALKIDEKRLGPDHPDVARDLNNLALVLQDTNRLAEAEPMMRRALKIDEASSGLEQSEAAPALANLAQLLRDTNRLAEAEPLMRRALNIDEASFGPDHPNVGIDLNNLAELLSATNRLREAEALYHRALKIDEASFGLDHSDVARDLNNLAQLLQDTNRLAEAEPMMRRALNIDEASFGPDHPNVARDLNNLAASFENRGHWSAAVALYARAKSIMIGVHGASELERGGLRKAVLVQSTGNLKGYARALHRADASDAANRAEGFELAQWALQNEAADALSSMAARFAKGGRELARLVRERQDLLADREAAYRSLDAAAGKADAKAAEAARAAIANIEAKLSEKHGQLRKDFPDYAELASPKPLSLPDAQALLGEGQALVLFLDLWQIGKVPEETIVFALTENEARWTSLPLGSGALRDRVTALRCGLDHTNWREGQESREICKKLLNTEVSEDRQPPFDAAAAHALYRDLFGGVEDLIKDKSLLVVPSGALTQLPFEALVTEKPDASLPRFEAYKSAGWLGQRQAVTVLPSVGSLKALRTAKGSAATDLFAGFGNPLLDGIDGKDKSAWAKQTCAKSPAPGQTRIAGLAAAFLSIFRGGQVDVENLRHQPPLPETADELCQVAQTLGVPEAGIDKAVYLGGRATVSQVKALSQSGALAKARVVHFATHGLLAGETAMFAKNKAEPALLLTPPAAATEEDNGLLTAS